MAAASPRITRTIINDQVASRAPQRRRLGFHSAVGIEERGQGLREHTSVRTLDQWNNGVSSVSRSIQQAMRRPYRITIIEEPEQKLDTDLA